MPAPSRPTARPPAPPPTPEERARLRRLVRGALVALVAAQAFALLLVASPPARAFAVAVTNFWQVTGWRGATLSTLDGQLTTTNRSLSTANERLQALRVMSERNMQRLGQNGQPRSAFTRESDVDSVTQRPMRLAFVRGSVAGQTSISVTDRDPAGALARVVPGATRWTNYGQERIASSEMALLTLRGGVRALHAFNRSIEDGGWLVAISQAAQNASSHHALGQLQIQAQVEVARQLQALRAQQALQTNLYAVTESHRVGVEARQFAFDHRSNCEVAETLISGYTMGLGGSLCRGSGGWAGSFLP